MNLPAINSVIVPGKGNQSPAPSLRSIVGKSALLNVVIVMTSFPVLDLCRGTKSRRPDPGNRGRDQRLDLDRHFHTVRIRLASLDLSDTGLLCDTT